MVAISRSTLRNGLPIVALAVLSACGGGAGAEAVQAPAIATVTARAVDLTDIEIAQLLYSDSQRVPAEFFKDSTSAYPGYVATAHLKSTDLAGASGASPFELCADDWTVALAWSDQAASALSASTLVETKATPRYHEFIRLRSGTPQGYLRTRVFRCDYLDRSAVDLRAAAGPGGKLNMQPITSTDLQQLAEYLWQFTDYNNYGNAVLKSSGTATASTLERTLVIASFAGTLSNCERVNVVGWKYSVNLQSGALTRETQSLWEFGARRNNGLVELCNPF